MTRVPAYLLLSTMLSAGFAFSALAQSAPATPPAATPPAASAPTPQAGAPDASVSGAAAEKEKADEARRRTETADRNAMFEAHLAALRAGLTLNPDQDRLWPPVEQAIRGFVAMRAEMMQRRADRMHGGADQENDDDPIAALKVYSDGLLTRAQALHSLSAAAEPLYATLSDEQKHRLPVLLRDMAPHDGPLARMADRFDREEGQGRGDGMNGGYGEQDRPRREGHHRARDWSRDDAQGDEMGPGEAGRRDMHRGDRPQGDMDRREGGDTWADAHDGDRTDRSTAERDRGMSDRDGESWHRGGRQHPMPDEDGGGDD